MKRLVEDSTVRDAHGFDKAVSVVLNSMEGSTTNHTVCADFVLGRMFGTLRMLLCLQLSLGRFYCLVQGMAGHEFFVKPVIEEHLLYSSFFFSPQWAVRVGTFWPLAWI